MQLFKSIHHPSLLLQEGNTWAEVAPLKNWSHETIEQAQAQLQQGGPVPLYPSVAFGISCMQLPPPPPFSIPIATLLSGSPDDIITRSHAARAAGFTCAKVKIASFTIKEAKSVLSHLIPLFSLRIDCNRQWRACDIVQLLSSFSPTDFAFVEEPTRDPSDLTTFPFPFALDETLRDHPEILNTPLPHLKAVIIKPTLTGSIDDCFRLVQKARALGASPIISSAHETGIGTYHLACLAKKWQEPGVAAGLGPYALRTADVLQNRLQIKQANLIIPSRIEGIQNELISCGTIQLPQLS